MENKREALIAATIDIVAESGLNNLAMRQITKRAGTSEALVYKYFDTKENLLYCCFESVHTKIAALFDNMTIPLNAKSQEELYTAVRLYWMVYFKYLVSGGNATIFYFTYRDSSYIRKIHEHDEARKIGYFKSFADFFKAVDEKAHIYDKVGSEYLWTYILDTSGIFAKRIIRGELPNTPEGFEDIWKLVSGGIMGLLLS